MSDAREQGHLNDEQIVQFVLEIAGEEEAKHVEGCEFCSGEADSYRRTLGHLDRWNTPERPADYGRDVWRKLRPRLRQRARRPKPSVWGWATAAAVGTLAAAMFLITRPSTIPKHAPQAAESAPVPARLLQAAVRDHVRRADRLLSQIEIEPTEGTAKHRDSASEREAIRDLIAENRLYRQTAEQEDDQKTAGLLADLETALVALKHDPQTASATDARNLRSRLIKAAGLNRPATRDVSSSDSEQQGVKRIPL